MKSALALSLASLATAVPVHNASSWHGWSHVRNFFVFGDSYTTTGFNVSGAQPSIENPLGNPAYPGYTSSNGPNWVDFLSTTYNASFIKTYNLAYGGATVDSALVTPYLPTVLSLKDQVQTEFLPVYGNGTWRASDSLFAFFIGINDVGNTWYAANSSAIQSAVFAVYNSLLEQVYKSGARNYLFLNVPPVNRAPLTLAQGQANVDQEGQAIAAWNTALINEVAEFKQRHSEITTFLFDTNTEFSAALDNPQIYPQTSVYKNTTAYCDAYENGTPSWYTFNATCGIAVNEYFWLNSLHPTFPMQNATAQAIARQLGGRSIR